MPAPAKPLHPGLAPGDRHLYIVYGGNIWVHSAITDSPDAIVSKDWSVELPKLVAEGGPPVFNGVEIHCHGTAANIHLGPDVTFDNVDQFGGLLRRLVKPGSLIEVLACMVARCDLGFLQDLMGAGPMLTARSPLRNDGLGSIASAAGGLKCDAPIETDAAPMWMDLLKSDTGYRAEQKAADTRFRQVSNNFVGSIPTVASLVGSMQAHNDTFYPSLEVDARFRASRGAPPSIAWRELFAIVDEACAKGMSRASVNGPRFCTRLAKASGCVVRAAWVPQVQERTFEGESSLIGDWESWVFDFDANGLKQVYFYLKRPVAGVGTWVASAIRPANGGAADRFVAANRLGIA